MQFHLSNFLSAPSSLEVSHQLSTVAEYPGHHCLLSGPERSGKTSLLFHCAFFWAKAGKTVLLLCDRGMGIVPKMSGHVQSNSTVGNHPFLWKKLEQVPPLLPENVQQTDAAWRLVHIKYIVCGKHLLRYAASLHLDNPLPDVVLVDDLHCYLDLSTVCQDRRPPTRDMVACKLMAVLHDAVDYIATRKGSPCLLVATETSSGEGPRSLYISQRWFSLFLAIKGTSGCFSLQIMPTQGANAECSPGWKAEYTFRQQWLCLEAVQRC